MIDRESQIAYSGSVVTAETFLEEGYIKKRFIPKILMMIKEHKSKITSPDIIFSLKSSKTLPIKDHGTSEADSNV
jgi:hypothetical protein